MKTKRQFRTGRPIRFSYQYGVQHYGHARPSKLAVGLMVVAMLLLPAVYQAKQLASNVLARSDQKPATAQLPTVPTQTIAPNSILPSQDEQLAQRIKRQLDSFPKDQKWSVYVEDIISERTAVIDGDEIYRPGNLQNLFLLPALENKVLVDTWSIKVKDKTLNQCLEAVLRVGDHSCEQIIQGLANPQYADTFNQDLGFSKTKLSSVGSQQTTARDTGTLLSKLRRGQLLSDKARRQVFDSLYGKKLATSISAGCKNCRVADTSSVQDDFVHSAAVVTHGKYSYILVIMSKGGTPQQITELTRIIEAELYP